MQGGAAQQDEWAGQTPPTCFEAPAMAMTSDLLQWVGVDCSSGCVPTGAVKGGITTEGITDCMYSNCRFNWIL